MIVIFNGEQEIENVTGIRVTENSIVVFVEGEPERYVYSKHVKRILIMLKDKSGDKSELS